MSSQTLFYQNAFRVLIDALIVVFAEDLKTNQTFPTLSTCSNFTKKVLHENLQSLISENYFLVKYVPGNFFRQPEAVAQQERNVRCQAEKKPFLQLKTRTEKKIGSPLFSNEDIGLHFQGKAHKTIPVGKAIKSSIRSSSIYFFFSFCFVLIRFACCKFSANF